MTGRSSSSAQISKRLTGKRLQRLRGHIRDQQPLCLECLQEGVLKEWDELDHIIPLYKGGTHDPENLQGLCKAHHVRKTELDLGRTVMPGCDARGNPLVRMEHWER
jgi:5-methylcytosine-specific restriction protein A